jgi:uncharacterized protein (TIGR00255 family)
VPWRFSGPLQQRRLIRAKRNMIYSMTGYAAISRDFEYGALNLELRSVNHRYLEIQFRLPEELRALEGAMREAVAAKLTRGKVDCRLGLTPSPSAARALPVNNDVLEQLLRYDAQVRAAAPEARALSVAEILGWPGIFDQQVRPIEKMSADSMALFGAALDELTATRLREGERLRLLLLERVERMELLARSVVPQIPQLIKAYQEKLAARLQEAMASHDDDRVRQELVLFASKIDVDEELSRLQTHLAEVKRVLETGGAVGKRLDFLMQELNRESNTLGAKSVASAVSQISMELKILIEQMREQIQNIE